MGQTVLDWYLEIEGAEIQAGFEDEHGNTTKLVSLDPSSNKLVISSRGLIDVGEGASVSQSHKGRSPLWLYLRETPLTRSGEKIENLAHTINGSNDVSHFHALSADILGSVTYVTGMTGASTTAEDAMTLGQGVCQDHAHIFISACRRAGHPARYISGYLHMDDRVDQDAMHAWAEVWIEDLGWTGFDISNGISPDNRYVRLAVGLDYNQAAPISGLTIGGAGESMKVDIQVQQQQ